jgi:plastocyanin
MMGKVAVFVVAGVAWLAALDAAPQPASPETIVVRMSNFTFTPQRLRLRSGSVVVLRLVNDSSGGHDLSAPELFAASAFPGGVAPAGGKVEVASRQTRDVVFVPGAPGNYTFECTHFLHSLFGMAGSVVVEGPAR